TPTWSSDDAKATRPNRLTRPYVGFTPTMPQYDAGCRTDPPVSEPSAMRTMPAATEAADPPDDPPGTRERRMGLSTGPYALFSFELPIANSSQFVLPTSTAPASRSRVITVASYGLTYPSRMREPHVVCRCVVAMLSFATNGIPARTPADGSASTAAASASAYGSSLQRMQLSPEGPASTSAMRRKASRTALTARVLTRTARRRR